MWPFKKQPVKVEQKYIRVELNAQDDDHKRAENLLKIGGMVITDTANVMIDNMVDGIKAYRELDESAFRDKIHAENEPKETPLADNNPAPDAPDLNKKTNKKGAKNG